MRRSTHTDRDRFRAVAAAAPAGTRVPVELRTVVDDPFAAYRRARDGPGGVFYETTGGRSGWGYFGLDPVERLTVSGDAVVAAAERGDATGGGSATDAAGSGDYRRPSPTLAALEGLVEGESLARGGCEVPYPCGAFGWLSYDVAREIESFPPPPEGRKAVDERGLPRLQVSLFDRVAAWECPVGGATRNGSATNDGSATDDDGATADGAVTLRVTACPRVPDGLDDPDEAREPLDALFDDGVARAADLIDRIEAGDPAAGPAPAPAAEAATFESDIGREGYAAAVDRVRERVREGDTFQANVSHRLTAPAAVHPVDAYDALRRVNPAPYSGLVEFGAASSGAGSGGGLPSGVDLVSASPELLLRREPSEDPDRGARLVTEPIAGTRPRGDGDEADAALEAELTGDEKERAEHAMLVDLERNDLGKVSRFGTVDVAEYRRVDRYSEVMHLVSRVEGEARPDVGLADAIAACFPGGTITGAPKPRTMAIVDGLEHTRRGPYTGSMLVAGFDGRATLNIVIRTLVRRAAEYRLRVGAGIVHDSDPDAEYAETLAKARALVTAVDEALTAGALAVEEPATEEAVGSKGETGDD